MALRIPQTMLQGLHDLPSSSTLLEAETVGILGNLRLVLPFTAPESQTPGKRALVRPVSAHQIGLACGHVSFPARTFATIAHRPILFMPSRSFHRQAFSPQGRALSQACSMRRSWRFGPETPMKFLREYWLTGAFAAAVIIAQGVV